MRMCGVKNYKCTKGFSEVNFFRWKVGIGKNNNTSKKIQFFSDNVSMNIVVRQLIQWTMKISSLIEKLLTLCNCQKSVKCNCYYYYYFFFYVKPKKHFIKHIPPIIQTNNEIVYNFWIVWYNIVLNNTSIIIIIMLLVRCSLKKAD